MSFQAAIREEALVRSRRCCCVCHEFAGLYVNVHHIQPRSEGGPDTIENAIVLCLRCHGEVGHYNPGHPIGNKYSASELRRHRDEWWRWCRENATVALPTHPIAVSPGMIDLGSGAWRSNFLLKIYNKSDDPFYQIYVKFRLRSPDIPIQAIDITGDLADPLLEFKIGPVVLNAHTYRLTGEDASGNKALYLWLHYLDPHQVRTYVVRVVGPDILSASEQHLAEISLASFEREPPRIREVQGGVALPLRLPENFRMHSTSLVLRRQVGVV